MTEAQYQKGLVRRIKERFPGCVLQKNDPSYQQGMLDWTIFYQHTWGCFEVKASAKASTQPNQKYFVEQLDKMSFAAFIYPENEEEVLLAMERAFASRGCARVS